MKYLSDCRHVTAQAKVRWTLLHFTLNVAMRGLKAFKINCDTAEPLFQGFYA